MKRNNSQRDTKFAFNCIHSSADEELTTSFVSPRPTVQERNSRITPIVFLV